MDSGLGFGPFTLYPTRHELHHLGQPVSIGSRALAILITLAEQAGRMVDKRDLIARAWPRLAIEECNLRSQVAALRKLFKALDPGSDGYIVTVPRQGYVLAASPVPAQEPCADADRLLAHLGRHDLVTLCGPEGAGKTRLARCLVEAHSQRFADGVYFIEADRHSQYQDLASFFSCNRLARPDHPCPAHVSQLAARQALLVFDSPEAFIEPLRALIAGLPARGRRLKVLVTCRQPLGLAGEAVVALAAAHAAAPCDLERWRLPACAA
ncbi:winged helix-turn-helix domain-containing protein [Pseudomonas sp. NPDC007930]|uniref:winged helix-turn-helix domain-containing protein n=1 Tax=Pseudomonas sp. NPDC007930 TaxID=3364417 RepID=UPI0036EBA67E